MTRATALRLIRKNQYATVDAARKDLSLRYVGAGSFRHTYLIADADLVIKFPHREDDGTGANDGKVHTRAEFRKIKKLSKFKSLRKHLPLVYYYSSADGVIVTQYYQTASAGEYARFAGPLMSGVIKELTGVALEDLYGDNTRLHKSGKGLVFVDLGY